MLRAISRRPTISCAETYMSILARHCTQRGFSAVSTHKVFPATLLRLNAGAKSNLYEHQSENPPQHQNPEDAVKVSSDGLVRADVYKTLPFSNGAGLMPNTFMMQEIVRTAVDHYADDVESGMSVERPVIFTIPKGTPVPNSLALIREHTSQFSLQPSQPTLLNGLNDTLQKFYSEYGEEQTAEQWLDNHDFNSAHADDAERDWMAH